MNFHNRYILFLKATGQVFITSDGPKIAEKIGVSKHTIISWFREGNSVVDRYEKSGFILVKGAEYIKSSRGKNNFKREKYNW